MADADAVIVGNLLPRLAAGDRLRELREQRLRACIGAAPRISWEWPPGGWGYKTTQGVGKALQRAHKAAGLPYRDGHELGRHAFAARWLRAGKGMKGLQLAGNWKKFSVPADIYGHLEITDVHSQMRELSEGVKIVVKPSEGEKLKY